MLLGNSNQVNVDSTDGIPTPQKYLDAAKDLNDFRKEERNDSQRIQLRDSAHDAIDKSHSGVNTVRTIRINMRMLI